MVTNGYLLDVLLEDFEELSISSIQITLDGTRESHDTTRCLLNGEGTFNKILENIDKLTLMQKSVLVMIRMNITNNNANLYAELHNILKKRYNSNVQLYPAFTRDYTGAKNKHDYFKTDSAKFDFLKAILEEDGIYTGNISINRKMKGCMKQQLNSFVVGPDGELSKCWHDLGIENRTVGNICNENEIYDYGVLSEMMLEGDVILSDGKCKECVLYPSCDGGCAMDRNNKKEHCHLAKKHLEEILDLKYQIIASKRKKCSNSEQM